MRNLATLRNASGYDASQTLRVLIAEDEPTQRLVLEQALSQAGYRVDVAVDGAQALALMQQNDYSMLVTDWAMPGIGGAALCREVRCGGMPHYVYIVILTGDDHGVDVVSGLDAGADDYVRKSAPRLELLARLAAGARIVRLEHSLRAAQARIELLSVMDPLLPLFNRRYLADELEQEIRRSRRYRRPLSVVAVDLDHFKAINDAHGHLVGDEVLLGVASVLTSRLRTSDWAARYGGEEFVIVLPETDLDGAVAAAEKLRGSCADTPIPTSVGNIGVTASFGVAALHRSGTALQDPPLGEGQPLLKAADDALYRSKADGRNRITAAS